MLAQIASDLHRIQARRKVELHRVQIGRDGVARTEWHSDRRIVPVEELHVLLIAQRPRSHDNRRALQIDDHVAVEAHSVLEQLVVNAQFVGHAHRERVARQTVQINVNRVHKPHDTSAVHDELVDDNLILGVKQRVRLRNDGQVKAVHTPGHALNLLRQHIQLSINSDVEHIVVRLQVHHKVRGFRLTQFPMALDECNAWSLLRNQFPHGPGHLVFQRVDGPLNHGLRRFRYF